MENRETNKLPSICFLMRIKNVTEKSQSLFEKVIENATKLSKNFLIIDNGSTDNTKEIIFKLKEKLNINLCYLIDKNPYYDSLVGQYVNKIKEEYTFVLADDEIITEALKDEIMEMLTKKKYLLFSIQFFTYFNNIPIDFNSRVYRLFKTTCRFFDSNADELHSEYNKNKIKNIPKKELCKLKNPLLHYSYPTIDFYLNKIKRYTQYEGELLYQKKPNLTILRLFFYMFKRMITTTVYHLFIIRRCFFSFHAFIYMLHSIIVYPVQIIMYYLEKKSNLNTKYSNIYIDNNES